MEIYRRIVDFLESIKNVKIEFDLENKTTNLEDYDSFSFDLYSEANEIKKDLQELYFRGDLDVFIKVKNELILLTKNLQLFEDGLIFNFKEKDIEIKIESEVVLGMNKIKLQYCEELVQHINKFFPQQTKYETEDEQQNNYANNFTISTIEDWLFYFRDQMTETDYKTLVSALTQYFDTGLFPELSKPIQINGRINKKHFGWHLSRIFVSQGKGIELELLQFAKQYISLFKDVQFDASNIFKSNLYKYLTTKISK